MICNSQIEILYNSYEEECLYACKIFTFLNTTCLLLNHSQDILKAEQILEKEHKKIADVTCYDSSVQK